MTSARDEAVVLHVRPYGEVDGIVSLFARQHGRISLYARGIRSAKRKNTTALQPSYVIALELSRKPGSDLFSGKAIDLVKQHPALSTDLLRLAGANVVLESVRELYRDGDGGAQVYEALKTTLLSIERESVLDIVNAFERGLLHTLGYGEAPEGLTGHLLFRRHTQMMESARGHKLSAREFFVSVW